MLSLTVKKLDAFKFDGVTESDNTAFSLASKGGTQKVGESTIETYSDESRRDGFRHLWKRLCCVVTFEISGNHLSHRSSGLLTAYESSH